MVAQTCTAVKSLGEAQDVKMSMHTLGIWGSDVHYYEYGPFVVKEPMALGHEASGTVVEVGDAVKKIKPSDRVCMEAGMPDGNHSVSRLGIYNRDPAVRLGDAARPGHLS